MFTGYFGPLTKKAVIRFQKSQGILQTGIVGVKTTAAICAGKSNSEITNDTDSLDLAITGLDINPKQIDVGTNIQILVKEQNISNVTSGSHTTSLYINEKEVVDNSISKLASGGEKLSINYD
jgi:peptidoglycan hydrolase-like protein with peptidoglycan-binding domain